MQYSIPYGNGFQTVEIEEERVAAVLTPREEAPDADAEAIVAEALSHPIGSERLSSLAKGKHSVVVICSDHTRPVPSRILIPAMLREIRAGNPQAEVTLLIATGCHRGMTAEELERKFGAEIVRNERIVMHDCDDEAQLCPLGVLPSGAECRINRLAAQADLLVAEGFIEPHFFAGFSGGRKSVLPGVASRETVLGNHCAEFIASPYARTGILRRNPIHEDMIWAAKRAGLAFIVNVVLGSGGRVLKAFAGDCAAAHAAGCAYSEKLSSVRACMADIVITSNNGYPLDQNVYQAVKGMTAAEATVRPGGVIIMAAKSADGHGGKGFYEMACRCARPEALLGEIERRSRSETVPDQWQAQIYARVLSRARVVYVSDCAPELIKRMNMIPAVDLNDALAKARALLSDEKARITIIPDGVSVIVKP